MPVDGVNAAGAGATAGTQNQTASANDAAAKQQFDQALSTAFATILTPLVQMVLSNTGEG